MTVSQSVDPSGFRAFEHSGWQKIPRQYHEAFSDLTPQAIGPLLDAIGVRKGIQLLDVASGPGYATVAAVRRGANAVGIDFSAEMVAEAKRQHPAVEFQEGDAEELPFPDGSFDAVVINFGLLHFARPEQALKEAHRVLRSRGKIGFTVWDKPEKAIGFSIVLRAIQAHGNMNVPIPPGPPFFRFSDPEECSQALRQAGFVTPNVVGVPLVLRLKSPEALFKLMQEGTVRTAGILGAQSTEALAAISKAIRDAARAYQKAETIELPMPAVLSSATKS